MVRKIADLEDRKDVTLSQQGVPNNGDNNPSHEVRRIYIQTRQNTY